MNQTMNNNRYVYGSLARISDLPATQSSWAVHPINRDKWETGDYVVGKYDSTPSTPDYIELTTGRRANLMKDDLLVGTLAVRKATLESVGDWHDIGIDGRMEDLTKAGFFAKEENRNIRIPPAPSFIYQGHVIRKGSKVCMRDFVPQEVTYSRPFNSPTVLILGTSMSCGKTYAAKVIIHLLKKMGVGKVVGTKLAGAGCYNDILNMQDAGADAVLDFVDAGLPSTIVPVEQYRHSLKLLLSMISEQNPDIVVAEAGASPLEEYNDASILSVLAQHARFVVLCASDAYAVVGIEEAFGVKPTIITGIVTATSAGIELVEKLSDVPALNLCTDKSITELELLLRAFLNDVLPPALDVGN
jgi:hypothetical protein